MWNLFNSNLKRKEENAIWLEGNKSREEVITLPSGLQYEILEKGDGPQPKLEQKVKVHYHGTLTNGKVFDSSVARNEPISFPLAAVIKGWQEGLQLMPLGSKYRLFIPPNLGYGGRTMGQIPAFSILIFEVELLDIL
jgi:FKBP-type peptidyl-prolyl cis-trans isomerase FklB